MINYFNGKMKIFFGKKINKGYFIRCNNIDSKVFSIIKEIVNSNLLETFTSENHSDSAKYCLRRYPYGCYDTYKTIEKYEEYSKHLTNFSFPKPAKTLGYSIIMWMLLVIGTGMMTNTSYAQDKKQDVEKPDERLKHYAFEYMKRKDRDKYPPLVSFAMSVLNGRIPEVTSGMYVTACQFINRHNITDDGYKMAINVARIRTKKIDERVRKMAKLLASPTDNLSPKEKIEYYKKLIKSEKDSSKIYYNYQRILDYARGGPNSTHKEMMNYAIQAYKYAETTKQKLEMIDEERKAIASMPIEQRTQKYIKRLYEIIEEMKKLDPNDELGFYTKSREIKERILRAD